jgi:hypothetical protein
MKRIVIALFLTASNAPLFGSLPKPDLTDRLSRSDPRNSIDARRAYVERRDFLRRQERRRQGIALLRAQREANLNQRRAEFGRQAFLSRLEAATGRNDIDTLLNQIDHGNVIAHGAENQEAADGLIAQLRALNLSTQTAPDAAAALAAQLEQLEVRENHE